MLPVLLGLPATACAVLLERSTTLTVAGTTVLRRSLLGRLVTELVERVKLHHRQEPFEPGMSLETLRRSLSVAEPIADAVVAAARDSGKLTTAGGLAALPGFRPLARVSESDLDRLLAAVREGGLTVPNASELAERLQFPDAEAGLRQAASAGEVQLVEPGRYLAAEALEGFARQLQELGTAGEITPGAVRDRTGLSRKYLIPLLEWADRNGITRREGDHRLLRASSAGASRGA